MRQTPFGVWNGKPTPTPRARRKCSNEADAFRRLESGEGGLWAVCVRMLQ